MNEQNHYMLMFSLGPVQPFIEQARKTRDLWIGSLLIAKLMEAAMEGIPKEAFIFPAEQKVEAIPDIPNKYVALFSEQRDAQDAAKRSVANIKVHWEEICKVVWNTIVAHKSDDETQSIWKRQTNFCTLFEVYWAIAKRKDKQLYKDWLEETELLLAARKRLRDFKPQDEPGEKSSISGNREVLHGKRGDRGGIKDFWKRFVIAYSSNDISQDATEHLDAIDIIKRFAMQANAISSEQPFPSTSSIATASFIESLLSSNIDSKVLEEWWKVTYRNPTLLSPEAANAIPYLVQKAKSSRSGDQQWILRCDGDLYFSSIFTPHQLEKNYNIKEPSPVRTIIREGQEALKNLLTATDIELITCPTPYYAVIKMDGDKMGILLSGVAGEEEHRNISGALSCFARRTVPSLVEKAYPGRLVYSGGDDVLAFAPLARDKPEIDQPKHVFDLANTLQSRYREIVKGALPLPQEEKRLQGVTASTGIVIAHHYSPLSFVLRSVREAEHAAKNLYGRNALVVTVLRRSGEQTRVGCHWRYSDLPEENQPISLFSRFFTLFKDDMLSPKCIYVLLEEASALVGLERETQESEVKRVFLRHLLHEQSNKELQKDGHENQDREQEGKQSKGEGRKGELKLLAGHLVNLARAMDAVADKTTSADGKQKLPAVELRADTRRYGIVETLGWLLVMAFLARKDQE